VGSLVTKGKIEARIDSDVKEGLDLAKALNNSNALLSILLTPQLEFTTVEIRRAKELYQELFSQPSSGTDARSLGAEWISSIGSLEAEVDNLVHNSNLYPFLSALKPFHQTLNHIKGKPANWYISEAPKLEDDLLNAKEDIFDKVKSFMGGSQKGIYDDARNMLNDQSSNIGYVDPETGKILRAALEDPNCYMGSTIQNIKSKITDLKNNVELKVLEERKAVISEVDEVGAKIAKMPDFQALDADKQASITTFIDNHKIGLDTITLIPTLRDRTNSARTNLLADAVNEVARLAQPEAETDSQVPTTILASTLKVKTPKTLLTDEADVEQYLEEMRKTLLAEIRAGKKVIV